jgi:hypothetical protein
MDLISREEYLKALDVVEAYHEQPRREVVNAEPNAIPVKFFMEWLRNIDPGHHGVSKLNVGRIRQCLRCFYNPLDDINGISREPYRNWRGQGNKFWETFEKLRELYKSNLYK